MCHLIDTTVPGDKRFASKEMEQIQKYKDLAWPGKFLRFGRLKWKYYPWWLERSAPFRKHWGTFLDETGTNVKKDTFTRRRQRRFCEQQCSYEGLWVKRDFVQLETKDNLITCFVFERAMAPRHFLLGHHMRILSNSTGEFQGHQCYGQGNLGNRISCLRE